MTLRGEVTIEVPGPFTEALKKKLDRGLDDVADFILTASQELVPVDTGNLKRSGIIEREFLEKSIRYEAPYAEPVEYGRQPGFMPPVEPFIKWAHRHGSKDPERAAWAIAIKIKNEGIPPRPFLRPALVQVEGQMGRIMQAQMDRGD